MTRYDWPRPPKNRDNPLLRSEHLERVRPLADAAASDVSSTPASQPHLGLLPHDAPASTTNLWVPIGPSVMTNGQATGKPNVAGRIRDLQVEIHDGLRVYAGSASGGVWFSPDAGSSWAPLDDWQQMADRSHVGIVANSLSCGAVQVIWPATLPGQADGSEDEIWVGTGESGGSRGIPGGHVGGIGFLHRPPGGAWSVVKGDRSDPDGLNGETVQRIAADPDPAHRGQLVAATSKGIYVLPTGGSWTRSTRWPSVGTVADHRPVDVLLTRNGATIRIWVAEFGHLWVADAVGTAPIDASTLSFHEIPVPHAIPGRMALAATHDGATVYLVGLRARTAADVVASPGVKIDQSAADLWRINATAAIGSLAATELPTAVPIDVFRSSGDQSGYDMSIAVHPTTGFVYVGGAYINGDGAIYRVDPTVATPAPTFIGSGAHADDHVLRFGGTSAVNGPKLDLWLGCDGGVFRSDSDGDPGTFAARNDGLAVLQPGYVASHPLNPGLVAAGFQDNGVAQRVGDTVWIQTMEGDGGGVAWDPDISVNANSRFMAQYLKSSWSSNDNALQPPVLRGAAPPVPNGKTSEELEDTAASFYSGCDAASLGPGDTHIAIGTNRLWYSVDFGRHWVTVPTGTDPRSGNPNDTQDVYRPQISTGSTCSDDPPSLPPGIIAVKFTVPTPTATAERLRAIVLYPGGLVWFTGTRPLNGTGAFTWYKPTKDVPTPVQAFRAPSTDLEKQALANGSPLHFLPTPGLVSDVAVHDPNLGLLGSLYVTTIGDRKFADGVTGQQTDTVWFFDGTDMWYPCGFRTHNPDRGTWTGTQISAPALGVVVDQVGTNRDIVYVATSVGVVRGQLTTIGGPSFSWKWQLFANGLPEAAVQDLSIHAYANGTVRLLRAALQARGVWETDLATPSSSPLTYLRTYPSDTRRALPSPLTGGLTAGEAAPPRWDLSPDVIVDQNRVAGPNPTEAVLAVIATGAAPGPVAAAQITPRNPLVHVLLHHRSGTSAVPGDVRVALLRHALTAAGGVPIGNLWPALVAIAGGTAPGALPDGWTAAGAELVQTLAAPPHTPLPALETRRPVPVTFDLAFTDGAGTTMVLLAVVLTSTGQTISTVDLRLTDGTSATTLEQLVTTSPHAAAVSIALL